MTVQTNHWDSFDWSFVIKKQLNTVCTVSLYSQVQRRQTILGFCGDDSASLKKSTDDTVLAAPCSTVKRRQTILSINTE